jgi:hypothetical protein
MTINNNEKFWELNYSSLDHNNECKFFQNFSTFSKTFDFNDLSDTLNEEDVSSNVLNHVDSTQLFNSVFQARNVHYSDNLMQLYNEIDAIFNTENINSDSDLFFSFNSNSSTLEHKEDYDILFLQLFGSSNIVFNASINTLNVGDAFFMPKDQSYHILSSESYIILSLGLRGDIARTYPWANES